jgi:hypothetical protein
MVTTLQDTDNESDQQMIDFDNLFSEHFQHFCIAKGISLVFPSKYAVSVGDKTRS